MRKLACFCFSFAAGVFAAQYLLPVWLLPYAAGGCALLGLLWAILLREDNRRRAALIGAGLALALCWDWAYVRLVQQPYEAMAGTTQELLMETADYPSLTEYGCRIEVRILGRGLHGKAIYYGGAELADAEPGTHLTGRVYVSSAATIRETEVTTHTSRGVFALLYGRGAAAAAPGRAGELRYLPQRLAHRMQEVIHACFPERTQAFLSAILLGDRYELSVADKAALSEAGLYHVTAVSGLHCAFLIALLAFFIGRHRERLLSAVSIPVLVLYALTAGVTPSVVRACIMLILLLIAPLFERESDPPTSLSLALFLILLWNPFAAKSVSLQLSFAAMAGLIWLTPKLYARFRKKGRKRAARFVLASLFTTAGALVFTVPLTAFYFGYLPLVAPLSNLLCLWAATLTFAAGLLTVLLGFVWPAAAQIAAFVPHCGALYLLTAARWLAGLPFHAVFFSSDTLRLWLAYVYAMLGVCLLAKRGRLRYVVTGVLAAASLALVLWLNAQPFRSGTLHMTALDVGQGQSVVLHSHGATALIDCGSSSYLDAGSTAADYLRGSGVRSIDYVVLSHYHDDHCDGLASLLARMKVGALILPDIAPEDPFRAQVLALAEAYGVPVTYAREELTLPLGAAVLTVFPPLTEGEMNEECISVLCTAGSFDALFTGDMDANTEYLLIASHPLPDIEVLMAGHHGSKYSTGEDLLAEVKPEIAVISCGAGNSYGHPNDETLRRLVSAGVSICRTDLQGTIEISVD